MDKNVWLVMSGSGMKLAAFLGAIRALVNNGYRFKGVRGTSGGAIVAAALAANWDETDPRGSVERTIEMALEFNVGALLDRRWLHQLALPWGGPKGIYKGAKILGALRSRLPKTFAGCKIPVEVVTFEINLTDKRTVIHTEGDLPLAVRASMSIPILFDPVKIGDGLHIDGGWGRNFALIADEDVVGLYFGLDARKDGRQKIANNLDLGLALVDGAIDENMRRDLEGAPAAMAIPLTTSIGSLDLAASGIEIAAAIREGEESCLDYLGKFGS